MRSIGTLQHINQTRFNLKRTWSLACVIKCQLIQLLKGERLAILRNSLNEGTLILRRCTTANVLVHCSVINSNVPVTHIHRVLSTTLYCFGVVVIFRGALANFEGVLTFGNY